MPASMTSWSPKSTTSAASAMVRVVPSTPVTDAEPSTRKRACSGPGRATVVAPEDGHHAGGQHRHDHHGEPDPPVHDASLPCARRAGSCARWCPARLGRARQLAAVGAHDAAHEGQTRARDHRSAGWPTRRLGRSPRRSPPGARGRCPTPWSSTASTSSGSGAVPVHRRAQPDPCRRRASTSPRCRSARRAPGRRSGGRASPVARRAPTRRLRRWRVRQPVTPPLDRAVEQSRGPRPARRGAQPAGGQRGEAARAGR